MYANSFQCISDKMRDFYFLCSFIAMQQMLFIPNILMLVIISLELYNNPVKDASHTAVYPLGRRKQGRLGGQWLAKVSSQRAQQLVKELCLQDSSLYSQPTVRALKFSSALATLRNTEKYTRSLETIVFLALFLEHHHGRSEMPWKRPQANGDLADAAPNKL